MALEPYRPTSDPRYRDELDRETFQRLWLHDHAKVVVAQPDTRHLIKRYVQLHNIGPLTEGMPFFHPASSRIDGVSVMAFASMKDVETFLLSDSYAAIEQSERDLGAKIVVRAVATAGG